MLENNYYLKQIASTDIDIMCKKLSTVDCEQPV